MSVLIGLVDQKIESSEAEKSWNVNKIGGYPSWLNAPLSQDAPKCGVCGHPSSLICQLYCPLGGSPYHRCLYTFACLSDCSKKPEGWQVVRCLKLDETYSERSPKGHQSDTWIDDESESWLDDQDDWGDDQDDWGEETQGHGEDTWGQISGDVVLEEEDTCTDTTADIDNQILSTIGQGEKCVTDHAALTFSSGNTLSSGTVEEEMDTSAFSQLKISEASSGEPLKALSPSSQIKQQVDLSDQSSGDGQGLTEESIMLVSDESRLNAITDLLNTKHAQDSKHNTTSPESESTNVPPSSLQPYYLCVIEEPADTKEAASDHISELIKSYEKTEGKSVDNLISDGGKKTGKGSSKESYEKAELKHGDKIFHKFLKRLQRYPSQCVRYERSGSPLLVKPLVPSHNTGVEPCPYCRGQRVFELQLLPPLICSLRLKDGSPSPVEFGTVLIFTCENNCWKSTDCDLDLREEFIIFQSDPDEHLYR